MHSLMLNAATMTRSPVGREHHHLPMTTSMIAIQIISIAERKPFRSVHDDLPWLLDLMGKAALIRSDIGNLAMVNRMAAVY